MQNKNNVSGFSWFLGTRFSSRIPELALGGVVAVFGEVVVAFGRHVFGFGNDPAPFVLHQLVAGQQPFCLERGTVPHLLTGTEEFLVGPALDVVEPVRLAIRSFHRAPPLLLLYDLRFYSLPI